MKKSLLLLFTLVLSGCSLFPRATPVNTYTLEILSTKHVQDEVSAGSILIATPQADATLNSRRILLAPTSQERTYYAGAQWADSLPNLLQGTLIEAFEKSGHFTSASAPDAGIKSEHMLQTALRDFSAHYGSEREPRIALSLNIRLVDMDSRKVIATHHIDVEETAESNTLDAVVHAFNKAAQKGIAQTVQWATAKAFKN